MLKRRRRETNDPAKRTLKPKSRRKRNLPAEERRRELLDAALDLFSEKGMSITIQALADRVSVTQPLVHRYFRTRSDLIAGIRAKIQFSHWDPTWRELLTDRGRPLQERILDFYSRYLPQIYSAKWCRGFWYAALSDPTVAQEFLARVREEILLSIIGEARFKYGFPDLECKPANPRELELVWGMHSTAVFMGIRRYVYNTEVSPDLQTTVSDQMRAYLHIVPQVMEELMPSARAKPAHSARLRPPSRPIQERGRGRSEEERDARPPCTRLPPRPHRRPAEAGPRRQSRGTPHAFKWSAVPEPLRPPLRRRRRRWPLPASRRAPDDRRP